LREDAVADGPAPISAFFGVANFEDYLHGVIS
jgi:hypothetical protein